MEVKNQTESKGLNSLRRFIKDIDLFGITFNFRSNDRQKFSSVCSGLVFLCYCFFILAYILKSFSDYISFSDYRIQYIQRHNEDSNLKITKNNFFYSFRFTYQEGLSYNDIVNPGKSGNDTYLGNFGEENNVFGSVYEQLFDIENKYVQKTIIPSNATKKTKIAKYKCDKSRFKSSEFYEIMVGEKFNPLKNDYEESFLLQDQVCFNLSDYTLYGKYSDNTFSYFEITLKLNETYYKQNLNKLKSLLSGVIFKFALVHSDHLYDVSDLNEPIEKRIESTIYTYVDMYYYERVDVFFNELVYSTDKNLLVKDPFEHKNIKFSGSGKSVSPMAFRYDPTSTLSDKYNLVKYFLRPDLTQTVINVSYMKIPEFLSGVSAMSMNIFVGLNVICGFFNRMHAMQKIISKTMKCSDIFKQTNRKKIDYFINASKMNKGNIKANSQKNVQDKVKNSSLNANFVDCSNSINDNLKEKNINHSFSGNNYFDNSMRFGKELIANNNNYLSNFERDGDLKPKGFDKPLNIRKSSLIKEKINFKDATPLTDINDCSKGLRSKKEFIVSNNEKANDTNRSNKNLILNNTALDSSNNNNKSNNINNWIQEDSDSKINLNSGLTENNNNKSDWKEINTSKNNNNNKNYNLNNSSLDERDSFKSNANKYKSLEISNLDLISGYLCCRDLKQKKVFFNLAKLKFDENLNFVNYSKKMMEFDIIKYLIMDKNLLEVMNFISKPNISEDTEFAFKDPEYNSFFNNEHIMDNENNPNLNRLKEAHENLILSSDAKDLNAFVKERMLKLFDFQLQELK